MFSRLPEWVFMPLNQQKVQCVAFMRQNYGTCISTSKGEDTLVCWQGHNEMIFNPVTFWVWLKFSFTHQSFLWSLSYRLTTWCRVARVQSRSIQMVRFSHAVGHWLKGCCLSNYRVLNSINSCYCSWACRQYFFCSKQHADEGSRSI